MACEGFSAPSRSRHTCDKFPANDLFQTREAIVFKEESAKDSARSRRHEGGREIFDMYALGGGLWSRLAQV